MDTNTERVTGWESRLIEVPDTPAHNDAGIAIAEREHVGDNVQVDSIARLRMPRFDERRVANFADSGGVDLVRATRAVADLLDALGVNRDGESLAETPARVARAYGELLTPVPFEATTFPNDEAYDQLVLARDIPFSSLCEHHLLPFTGVAHVGYLPGKRLLGLSKLARVVTYYSRRLQVQERLTKQVADWLVGELDPKGVGVVLEAEHTCMSMRGVRAAGARTVTSALAGLVRDDQRTRSEFMSLVGRA